MRRLDVPMYHLSFHTFVELLNILNCSALFEAPIRWVHHSPALTALTRRDHLVVQLNELRRAANRPTNTLCLLFHNFDLPPAVGLGPSA